MTSFVWYGKTLMMAGRSPGEAGNRAVLGPLHGDEVGVKKGCCAVVLNSFSSAAGWSGLAYVCETDVHRLHRMFPNIHGHSDMLLKCIPKCWVLCAFSFDGAHPSKRNILQ